MSDQTIENLETPAEDIASEDAQQSLNALLKSKLGTNAFKEVGEFHIHIKEGKERDPKLDYAIAVCPAGLYTKQKDGTYAVSEDGCLECGTCLIACGSDVLDWRYPDAMCGVQYRLS